MSLSKRLPWIASLAVMVLNHATIGHDKAKSSKLTTSLGCAVFIFDYIEDRQL